MKTIEEIQQAIERKQPQTFRIAGYKAWIGFESWQDARIFARSIGGDTALLKKRDGQDWKLHGKCFGPLLGADYNEDAGLQGDECLAEDLELMAYHANVYTWSVAVVKH